ncbi:MAG: DUF4031 domain-containing protein [Gemmatimonadaceae bacterium]
MSVFIDDMRTPFRGMLMCHMIADSPDELHRMATAIGLARRWVQFPGTAREHYDISIETRAIAVQLGAVAVTRRELIMRIREKRAALGLSE